MELDVEEVDVLVEDVEVLVLEVEAPQIKASSGLHRSAIPLFLQHSTGVKFGSPKHVGV